jgi:transposase-like protein
MRAKMNLPTLMVDFDTDEECRKALEGFRWPDGVKCLRCGSDSISRIATRKQYDCNACRYRFSVTTGTIFHDSHLPLAKWFMAVLLMCEAKKGISANQMKRTLGVAHKTAWYLCHRIREAMIESQPAPLSGTVEVDETYIGGKWRGKKRSDDGRKDWRQRKAMVMGAIQRDGQLRMRTGPRATKEVLHGFIRTHVADNCERIYTDELSAYGGIADSNTTHEQVDHHAYEYVRGDVHTNTIEGAFGLFKRGLAGSFHQISVKHLDRYLDEFEFRYNNRKNEYLFRDTLTRLVTAKALQYDALTSNPA